MSSISNMGLFHVTDWVTTDDNVIYQTYFIVWFVLYSDID